MNTSTSPILLTNSITPGSPFNIIAIDVAMVLKSILDVGAIEDCVFGGLKLGSESSIDQVFKWAVHVLWGCDYFFSGWYGRNVLAIWNSNR